MVGDDNRNKVGMIVRFFLMQNNILKSIPAF